MLKKNDSKILNAWCSYDWANSVYALTISSAIFPVYYNEVTREAFGSDRVVFLGFTIENTVLYSWALSFSFLLVVFLSPLLSGVADYGGMKKTMMRFFTYLGSFSCLSLFFFRGDNLEFGIGMTVLASVGYAASLVFYNAYLPEIATPDRFDRISARGYAMGYIGSVLQLLFSLWIVLSPETFGLERGTLPARLSFLAVGVWWLGFAQIAFYYLPNNPHERTADREHLLKKGFRELQGVWKALTHMPHTKHYLRSFFFYSMGVQTIMLLAATFGEKELALESSKLIATVLVIQLVAIPGAYLFALLSERKGNKFSLLSMLAIWIGICVGAYYVRSEYQFYALATAVGLVMGGIQSLSRSTYSKLIPFNTKDTASFFSFYDVTEKLSVVAGTFCYGLIEQLTGSMRNSILVLGLFFVLGIVLMIPLRVRPPKNA